MCAQRFFSLTIRPYQVHPMYIFTREPNSEFHCVLYLGLTLMMPGPYFPITARFMHEEAPAQVFDVDSSGVVDRPRRRR